MKAYQCDRCGKYYSPNDLPPYIPDIVPSFRSGVKLDLCPACIDDFHEWIHTDFYFSDQVKRGHGFPSVIQKCARCLHWGYDNSGDTFNCNLEHEWRPSSLICKHWEPK